VLDGVVDFNRNGSRSIPDVLPVSGIPIYYHRCVNCGFLFTVAMDHFSPADFQTHVYNAGYAAVDPDHAEARPVGNAMTIEKLFGAHKRISILDYGSGKGVMAAKLREAGFEDVVTFDPFVQAHAERPQRRFDLVASFEVVEHSVRPHEVFADMDSLLKPNGVILFSTLIQSADSAKLGVSWWYVLPRNGHVSIFTSQALQMVLGARGLQFGSCSRDLHVAWRQVPEFAKGFIKV
jgi:SAM-dependent methyltransferase